MSYTTPIRIDFRVLNHQPDKIKLKGTIVFGKVDKLHVASQSQYLKAYYWKMEVSNFVSADIIYIFIYGLPL